MSCSCSRRRSVWSSNTRTAEPGSAMGMAVSSSTRSPARVSAVLADGSAVARATGSDQAGGGGGGHGGPGAGGSRVVGQSGPGPRGFFPYVLGERERPAPQRKLEKGVVGARRNGVRVVGHRQAVGLGVK